jgi:hypothetical protein
VRYADIIIALILQTIVAGALPGAVKLAGCALILSTVTVLLAKQRTKARAAAAAAAAEGAGGGAARGGAAGGGAAGGGAPFKASTDEEAVELADAVAAAAWGVG